MLLYPNWPVLPNKASEIYLAYHSKNGITFDNGQGMRKVNAPVLQSYLGTVVA
jgi:hypothetical protein